MLYPSEVDWAKWGISDECHKFFVLHWEELFNAETPDTWQVRTCNIVTMLGEIIDVARIARVRESAREYAVDLGRDLPGHRPGPDSLRTITPSYRPI